MRRSTDALDPSHERDSRIAREGNKPPYLSFLCVECAVPDTGIIYGWGTCTNCGRRDQLRAGAELSPHARGPFEDK